MISRGATLALAAIVIWLAATFGFDFFDKLSELGQHVRQTAQQFPSTESSQDPITGGSPGGQQPVALQRSPTHLTIGSFNIQVLGRSKMENPLAVPILVDLIRQFDVLAIQELRSVDQQVIPRLIQLVNENGHQYSFVLGPRQGNTSSKEQYVFVFDTTRVELIDPGYLVPDPQNLLHREPMVSSFRAIVADPQQAFTFTLMNIHTDPDVVQMELNSLPAAINFVRQYNPGEDDVILLGDLNASPDNLGGLATVPNIAAVIAPHWATNTRGTRNYDNLLFDRHRTTEFAGASGVINIMNRYQLTLDQALQVSDHLPVWGMFSVYESQAAYAQQPSPTLR